MKKLVFTTALLGATGVAAAAPVAAKPAAQSAVQSAVQSATQSATQSANFRLPRFETTKLPNGLTVMLMERHEVPLVAVRAVFRAGAVNDGAQAGLANLTGDAILLGSEKHDKAAIDEAFDFRGAQLAGGSATEQTTVQANFARNDAAALLPLFAEIVQQPSFEGAELDKLKSRKVSGLKQAKESPRQVAGTYFRSMLYGDAPYASPAGGTVGSLAALKRGDVQGFHERYFRPDNAAVIVVGDFDPAAMRQQIESLFGAWKAQGPAPQRADYGKPLAGKPRVWLVNKPDAIETTFVIGGPGIARSDAGYVPLQVLNTVLGGRFTSWLNDELRVNSGLTYGANSAFTPLAQSGTFAMSSFTASAKTEAALDLALKTYQRLWSQGIDKATLDSAKAYVKGQFPPRFETSEQLAALLGDMYALDVDRAQIDNFMRDIDGLDPAKAKALVDQYFPRNNLQMVLVGKADDIRKVAGKYGEVTELDISADGFRPAVK
ncbi:MAG TPA: pitrilysin family protein [Pseudoduganella sp.]